MVFGELVGVDAVDNRDVFVSGRRRDQNFFRAASQVSRGGFLVGENTGAFEDDIDAVIFPRNRGRIALLVDVDFFAIHNQRVAFIADVEIRAAMDAVILHQMGIGLGIGQIVDRDEFDVGAARFIQGPGDKTTDATKTIDTNFDCHNE